MRFPFQSMLRFGSVRVGLTVRVRYGSCRFGSCGSIRSVRGDQSVEWRVESVECECECKVWSVKSGV